MQKFFVSIFFVAIGLWFFLDGAVRWPSSNRRWDAHEKLVNEGREAEWPAEAARQGWVEKLPHKRYSSSDIGGQYIFGSIAVTIGVCLLLFWHTQRRRTLRTDEEAVYSPAGNRIPFNAITGLGKKKWESKGLATVRYSIDGRQGEFVIDDYKFDPIPAHQVVKEIEEQLLARVAGTQAGAGAPPESEAPPAE